MSNIPSQHQDFLALFWVQFLGAFNDNLVKNAVAILISYRLVADADAGLWLSVAAGLFIAPFVFISPWAGRLADQLDKVWLIRIIKLSEIVLALIAAWALMSQHLVGLLVAVTALGVQSACFGPIKYAIVPDRVPRQQWMQANAWFSGSTFVAILLGTLLGGLGALNHVSLMLLGFGVLVVALSGAWASFQIEPRTKVSWLSAGRLARSVGYWASFLAVWQGWHDGRGRLVIAISLFWFIGATLLSQLPFWVQLLGGNEQVAVLWLAGFALSFGVGVALRSLQKNAGWRQQGLWLFLMALVLAEAAWLSYHISPHAVDVLVPSEFFSSVTHLRISIDLALIALLGGLYTVPLYTQLQRQVSINQRSQAFALNNVLNALWMVLSAVGLMLGYSLGLTWPVIAAVLAFIMGIMALWVTWQFWQSNWLVISETTRG